MGNMGLKSMRFVPTNGKCESSTSAFYTPKAPRRTKAPRQSVSCISHCITWIILDRKKLKFGERWNSNGPAKPHPWSITVEIWANGIQWLRASRTTQAQSNYDWLSHQRACHSNGGRNTFIIALRMNMQQLRTRRSLSGGVSCWKQKVRVTMTCCLINGLALVAEEQTHHSFQYQHATTLPKQYSSESCRTTQAQSNYDWLSHQRACHSNGGRNTFIIALRMNMQKLRTRRSLSGGVSCWKQKVRVTMTCCLINGLALVAEEQTHHSFQYQHATTLPKQYSSESCRTTQAQSNYDWLSHQRACHSNGGRNTFIIALRMNMQQLRTRRSLSGGVSCWKQKVRVTMTCCLINGLALVAEEQTHHSFQYQHATTLPMQY